MSGSLGSPRKGGRSTTEQKQWVICVKKYRNYRWELASIPIVIWEEEEEEEAAGKTKESQTLTAWIIWLLFSVSGKDTKRQISIKDPNHSKQMKLPTTLVLFTTWHALGFSSILRQTCHFQLQMFFLHLRAQIKYIQVVSVLWSIFGPKSLGPVGL